MKMKELLAKPEAWTQGLYARDSAGRSASPHGDMTVCWCLIGALLRTYNPMKKLLASTPEAEEIERRIADEIHSVDIADWNDSPDRTHAEVLALCEKLDI